MTAATTRKDSPLVKKDPPPPPYLLRKQTKMILGLDFGLVGRDRWTHYYYYVLNPFGVLGRNVNLEFCADQALGFGAEEDYDEFAPGTRHRPRPYVLTFDRE